MEVFCSVLVNQFPVHFHTNHWSSLTHTFKSVHMNWKCVLNLIPVETNWKYAESVRKSEPPRVSVGIGYIIILHFQNIHRLCVKQSWQIPCCNPGRSSSLTAQISQMQLISVISSKLAMDRLGQSWRVPQLSWTYLKLCSKFYPL